MQQIKYIDIIKKLNSGGSASVYLGINTHTGFPVAVKELNENFFRNSFVKKKFIEEANRYLYLDHPNIVKLEDLILMPHTGYLVMEYVEGNNLREYMKQVTGPMPFQNVALLMTEAVGAIAYAHGQNMVHMDIKPSNIMLSSENEVKLIDFGISQDTNKTSSEYVMGTPYYMSPEQIEGRNVDHRTDIYSFGITIYELVTGSLPFDGSTTREELLHDVKRKNVPLVGSLNNMDRDMVDDMNAIIQKATQKDPAKRYQQCEELIEDLSTLI